MGLEYIFAFMENLIIFSMFGFTMAIIFMMFLLWSRYNNEIDKDDWVYLMAWDAGIIFIFLVPCLTPSLDHILEVKKRMAALEHVATIEISEKPVDKDIGNVLLLIKPPTWGLTQGVK